MLDDALTARIAAGKRRLLEGGLLQEVEWVFPPASGTYAAGDDHLFDARRAH